MRGPLKLLRYANVVATLALFLALGGGVVYAAGKIGTDEIARNAITSKQIRNGAVKERKLAPGAVTSTQVQDGSLLGADFAPGQLPAGPRGERGVPGPPGPTGLAGIEVVVFPGIVQPGDTQGRFLAPCPPGKVVLGGGVAVFNENIRVLTSTPVDTGTDWSVVVRPFAGATFGGAGPSAVNIRTVCADAAGPVR